MDRREFIKTTGTLLGAAALPSSSAFAVSYSSRITLPINRGWRFHPSWAQGAEATAFDDSSFEQVVVPHTNVQLPWHSFDDRRYEFVSTYRRRFRLPAEARGKRVFVDFEGIMTASTVWINGVRCGEYRGGFTPFSFELTPHLRWDVENVLVVQVDSTERSDIPPFGYEIDYMTFGGIYREVALRLVSDWFLDNIFARPLNVLGQKPLLEVDCFLASQSPSSGALSLEVELRDGERSVARTTRSVDAGDGAAADTMPGTVRHTIEMADLPGVRLWDLQNPHLYTVQVRLLRAGQVIDHDERRIGFREAAFTDGGFSLNGKIVKLRGLDRHQTFPFVGQAMPKRVQRRDAIILRHELHCNIVRTSHYPQSRHFLDCCDEIGLLVLEEIPGWQHIGNEEWKLAAIDNVGRMIRRDWNHPSIVLWGVRINESKDDHDFYLKTNQLAHALDSTRQTGGIRNFQASEFLEDVFTVNDFGFPLRPPNHPRYLNTEFVGHTFPTRTTDDNERQREHTLRHARIHDQLASDPQYAGGLGWCAFDYNTHANFGSGDRICYHGVMDIFREPKMAAGFYKSQCDPSEEVVLEPAFHWARGDESIGFTKAVFCSNCDRLQVFSRAASAQSNEWTSLAEILPDRADFSHLRYPPFLLDLSKFRAGWGDLRIDGYVGTRKVISKFMSGAGVDSRFIVSADDPTLTADGADTTRVVVRVTDEFGVIRPLANDSITFLLEGPAVLIGDNPFALVGGTGAIWIRAKEQPGRITLTARHPQLGAQTLTLFLDAAPSEIA